MPADVMVRGPNRRRGRPRMPRALGDATSTRCFVPECAPDEEGLAITLLPEEVELLRLIDLEGLEQEEAAAVLGVSRRTVWRDLHTARRKVAEALTTGKCLRMDRCPRVEQGKCPRNCRRGQRDS